MTDPNYYDDDDDEIFDRPTCVDYLISLLLFLYFRKCEKKYFNHAFLKGDLKGKNPSCKIQKHFFFCFVCLFHHVQHYYYYLIITKNDIFFPQNEPRRYVSSSSSSSSSWWCFTQHSIHGWRDKEMLFLNVYQKDMMTNDNCPLSSSLLKKTEMKLNHPST